MNITLSIKKTDLGKVMCLAKALGLETIDSYQNTSIE